MAAMHAIRDRHENAAGEQAESSPLHLALVEDVLYGLDINRHGIQLAACNLTLGNPRVDLQAHEPVHHAAWSATQGQSEGRIVGIPRRCEKRVGHRNVRLTTPYDGDLDADRAEPGAAPSESLTGSSISSS